MTRILLALLLCLSGMAPALAQGDSAECRELRELLASTRLKAHEDKTFLVKWEVDLQTKRAARDRASAKAQQTNSDADWTEFRLLAAAYEKFAADYRSLKEDFEEREREVAKLEVQTTMKCGPAPDAGADAIVAKLFGHVVAGCGAKKESFPIEIHLNKGKASGHYVVWGAKVPFDGPVARDGALDLDVAFPGAPKGTMKVRGKVFLVYGAWRGEGTLVDSSATAKKCMNWAAAPRS